MQTKIQDFIQQIIPFKFQEKEYNKFWNIEEQIFLPQIENFIHKNKKNWENLSPNIEVVNEVLSDIKESTLPMPLLCIAMEYIWKINLTHWGAKDTDILAKKNEYQTKKLELTERCKELFKKPNALLEKLQNINYAELTKESAESILNEIIALENTIPSTVKLQLFSELRSKLNQEEQTDLYNKISELQLETQEKIFKEFSTKIEQDISKIEELQSLKLMLKLEDYYYLTTLINSTKENIKLLPNSNQLLEKLDNVTEKTAQYNDDIFKKDIMDHFDRTIKQYPHGVYEYMKTMLNQQDSATWLHHNELKTPEDKILIIYLSKYIKHFGELNLNISLKLFNEIKEYINTTEKLKTVPEIIEDLKKSKNFLDIKSGIKSLLDIQKLDQENINNIVEIILTLFNNQVLNNQDPASINFNGILKIISQLEKKLPQSESISKLRDTVVIQHNKTLVGITEKVNDLIKNLGTNNQPNIDLGALAKNIKQNFFISQKLTFNPTTHDPEHSAKSMQSKLGYLRDEKLFNYMTGVWETHYKNITTSKVETPELLSRQPLFVQIIALQLWYDLTLLNSNALKDYLCLNDNIKLLVKQLKQKPQSNLTSLIKCLIKFYHFTNQDLSVDSDIFNHILLCDIDPNIKKSILRDIKDQINNILKDETKDKSKVTYLFSKCILTEIDISLNDKPNFNELYKLLKTLPQSNDPQIQEEYKTITYKLQHKESQLKFSIDIDLKGISRQFDRININYTQLYEKLNTILLNIHCITDPKKYLEQYNTIKSQLEQLLQSTIEKTIAQRIAMIQHKTPEEKEKILNKINTTIPTALKVIQSKLNDPVLSNEENTKLLKYLETINNIITNNNIEILDKSALLKTCDALILQGQVKDIYINIHGDKQQEEQTLSLNTTIPSILDVIQGKLNDPVLSNEENTKLLKYLKTINNAITNNNIEILDKSALLKTCHALILQGQVNDSIYTIYKKLDLLDTNVSQNIQTLQSQINGLSINSQEEYNKRYQKITARYNIEQVIPEKIRLIKKSDKPQFISAGLRITRTLINETQLNSNLSLEQKNKLSEYAQTIKEIEDKVQPKQANNKQTIEGSNIIPNIENPEENQESNIILNIEKPGTNQESTQKQTITQPNTNHRSYPFQFSLEWIYNLTNRLSSYVLKKNNSSHKENHK